MRCSVCGSEVTVYELFPRSSRLYIYLCKKCREGFLVHHFDSNLEIYQLAKIAMKRSNNLIFIEGLKVEPRVFDFKVSAEKDAVIVADEEEALGEIAGDMFMPYSEKSLMIVKTLLDNVENVIEEWRSAK